jgi:hypothetical protein
MIACSPSPTTTDAGPDGSLPDAGAGADANDATVNDAPDDAPADVAQEAAFDAGPCSLAPLDGGACNALTVTGNPITATCMNNVTLPTPVGGPIYNGHYVLTKIEYYDDPNGCVQAQAQKQDYSICGDDWETVEQSGAQPVTNIDITAAPSGTTLALTLTCPNAANVTWTYDATSTQLVFYLPEIGLDGGKALRADTFTKM